MQNNSNIRDKVEKSVEGMASAVHIITMYGDDHKLSKEALGSFYSLLSDILSDKTDITIGIISGEIAFEKEPFFETSEKIKSFIEHLVEINSNKITFSKGLTEQELAVFCKILSMQQHALEEAGGIKKLLDASSISSISIGKIGLGKVTTDKEESSKEEALVKQSFQEGLDFINTAKEDVNKNRPININSARQLVTGIVNHFLKNKNLLLVLTSTKSHDEGTFVHDLNVSIFALAQAEALGLDQKHLNDIGTAALLHDMGKVSVSGEETLDIDLLSEEDRSKMSLMAVNGAKILLETPDLTPLAAIIAFEHNMGYDNSGYPKKLYGKGASIISMMISIADYYDKSRLKRSYHGWVPPEKTYEDMMKHSGKFFHPDLLKNFFSIIGVYPPGTLVELNTKEVGLVVKENVLDIKRPHVQILYNVNGEQDKEMRIINLMDQDSRKDYKWTIIKSLSPSNRFMIPEKYL